MVFYCTMSGLAGISTGNYVPQVHGVRMGRGEWWNGTEMDRIQEESRKSVIMVQKRESVDLAIKHVHFII